MKTWERIAILLSGMAILISFLLILELELESQKSPEGQTGEPIVIQTAIPAVKELTAIGPYDEENSESRELDAILLAQCMESEDGIDWSDDDIMCIGEVVLNRVASPYFPDTVMGVLYQDGQYQPFIEGTIPAEPDQHYIDLAYKLLDGYRVMDDPDVIWQALFTQGSEVVRTVYDEALGSTTYFCKN